MPVKLTNYTEAQIDDILSNIKDCIKKDKFTISANSKREENKEFISAYNLRRKDQKRILLEIQTIDFCYATPNEHKGFEHEILYIFAPEINLVNAFGEDKTLVIYVKINFIEENDYTVVISFHELCYPINYLFK